MRITILKKRRLQLKKVKSYMTLTAVTLSSLHCGISHLNAMENSNPQDSNIRHTMFQDGDQSSAGTQRRTPAGGHVGDPYAGGYMQAPAGGHGGDPYAGGSMMGSPYSGGAQ